MNINSWNDGRNIGNMVEVSTKEAYRIIRSLASQLENNNSTEGRAEFKDKFGDYFSIAIIDLKG